MQTQTSTHAKINGKETVELSSVPLDRSAGVPNTLNSTQDRLIRLPEILQNYLPISRSTFYNKIKSGEIKPPVKLSERVACWRESDILAYIAKQEAQS
ncbi:MAG: AlpA family phage regulatory protein [Hyphomicrobiales bacterium]